MKLHFPYALLLTLSIVAFASAQPNAQGFLSCLLTHTNDASISSIIVTPQNSAFLSVLDFLIQNARFINPQTPKPIAILTPVQESQIQTAIYCSKQNNIQIRVRSGGHDFEGSSYISQVPFFVLDLFNFQSVQVDSASKTAWVGAGASLGQVYWKIYAQNNLLAFPAGFWRTVGAGGHITGGGYGPLTRHYGLSANNVLDARVVDANGRILDRQSMGEDFFWAIRGGVGSNFAVITSYKLNLVEVPPIVSGFQVARTLEQNAVQLVYKWQQIARNLPIEVTLNVQITGIVSPVTGNRTVQAQFFTAYRGRADALFSIFGEFFPELGLTKEDVQEMQWIQAYPFLLGSTLSVDDTRIYLTNRTNDNTPFKWKVDFAQDPIPPEGLEKIFSQLNLIPPNASQLGWTVFGGGIMDRLPASTIPFPYRGKLMIMRQIVYWNVTDSPAVVQSRISWVRQLHDITGRYVPNNPRAQYADYRDHDLGVNNLYGPTSIEHARRTWGIPYFNNNFDRLVRVKTLVDPQNFFKFEQSFPPLPRF